MKKSLIVDNELVLYGDVGDMWGDGSGFTGHDVIEALTQFAGKNEITVRLNSGGGVVFDGLSIYNSLKAFPGKVNIFIDGVAASAASLIAMAGDEITMRTGTMIMIHDPSGMTWGTAADHTKQAQLLDQLGEQAAMIYAMRTGMSSKEARAMMLTETWLDGEESVEFKFATTHENITGVAPVMGIPKFDYTMYSKVPAHIIASGQRDRPTPQLKMKKDDPKMPDPIAVLPAPVQVPVPQMAAPAPVVPAVDVTMEILTRGKAARLSVEKITEIITAAAGSLDKAKDLLLEAAVARDPSPEHHPAIVTEDGRDKFRMGIEKAIAARAGLEGGERNEFTSLTMREIARECLMFGGNKKKFNDPMTMIGEAFRPTMFAGGHSTSDFTEVLGNTANKSMLIGFDETEENYSKWTGVGTLGDFKIATRVDLGLFPNITAVPEGAEYNYATMSDRKITLQLATYGKMFSITRQAIINDDLSAFTRVPNRMGRAVKRTIANLVYAQLTGNVTLDDGIALFHSSHANLTTVGGPPTVATVGVARTMMAKQTDPDSIASGGLNIRPSFMLVPLELEDTARVIMSAEFDPSVASGRSPNVVRGAMEVIADARLSTDSAFKWYTIASPRNTDTIEVLYLNGVQTPMMEQRDGWNVDGVEFKVRMDTGVKTLGHRGFYQNDGVP